MNFLSNRAAISSDVHSEYLYTAAAVDFIATHTANHKGSPMFLYFGSQLIHETWEAPDSFIATCTDAAVGNNATHDQIVYCAMNLMLDEVVG